MKLKYPVVAILLFGAACTSSKHFQPADADLAIAQQRIPGITINDLQSGYKLYAMDCSACHRLHSPEEYTAQQWKPILAEMFQKAKVNDVKQRELIGNYLIAKSK